MATITITTNSAQDARIAAAFGTLLGLGRSATAAEVRGYLINHFRQIVLEQELRVAREAADASVTPVDLT